MSDVIVLTLGIQGPTGPPTVTAGSLITSRGDLIYGNATPVAARLPIGAASTFLRSNGTDPSWSAILAADLPAAIDAAKIGNGLVSTTEYQFLSAVTSDIQTQINGKSDTAHIHINTANRGIFFDRSVQNTSDTDNTSSTSVWATAMDYTMTLPTGSYEVTAFGGLAVKHSASGAAIVRVSVALQDSAGKTTGPMSSTVYTPWMDIDHIASELAGVRLKVQFHSVDAGTTYARNPWVVALCNRIA